MGFRKIAIGIIAVAWLGVTAFNAVGQESDDLELSAEDNTLTESTGPVYYESHAGDFNIRFPGGCAKTIERIPIDPDPDVEKDFILVAVHVFCDREGFSGEGCSVTAYVDDDVDTEPSVDSGFVGARVQAVLATFKANVVTQKPYHLVIEDGPMMDGVDVLATGPENKGQIWVRGLLVEGDAYILTAWRSDGPLALDQDFVSFFESFRAHGS